MGLDKRKPYGVVSGETTVRFEQDGKLFDAEGEEIDHADEPKAPKAPKAVKEKAATKENAEKAPVAPVIPADEQLAAQVSE